MSKTVKAFKIDSFSHDTGSKHPEFVGIFSESEKKIRPEDQQPSTEEQARKIFEDAFVQGEKAGHEMGMKKVEQVVKRLNNYLAELEVFSDQIRKQAEAFSVELALTFAEAIVLRECSEKSDLVMGMAKRAFEICEDKCDIVIRVRREDAELLSQNAMSHIKIIPDDTLKEPGFIVETGFGDIDGRISTQLEELRKEFLNERSF
ncbi:MAG: flagellar assembly protein [Deltaproteobacteria bacterium]|nr:flagellar assembly protein [Deltaproteobacteria bacterium]